MSNLIGKNPNNASAIIPYYEKRILLQKRSNNPSIYYPSFWGCFGGALNKRENYEKAIIREVKEELNVDVNNKCIAPLSFSEFDYKEFQLLLLLYVCRRWDGHPTSMENNKLKWVKPSMLRNYKMPPADDALIYCLQDLF